MTKREYATQIAERIENAKVEEVIKNGQKKTAITIRDIESNVSPVIYIDEMYKQNKEIDEAVAVIKAIYDENRVEDTDMEYIKEYDKIKDSLSARLLNKKNAINEMSIPAAKYGFNDLVIVPIINVEINGTKGQAKINPNLLQTWNKSIYDVVNDAIENIKKKTQVVNMIEMLANMMGIDKEEAIKMSGQPDVDVVSIENSEPYGAIAIIAVLEQIADKYQNGFYVIPSSVHEVLVMNADGIDSDELEKIINQVNNTCVKPEDYLSNHPYKIAA